MMFIRWILAPVSTCALAFSLALGTGCGAPAEAITNEPPVGTATEALSSRPDESKTPGTLCSPSDKDFDGYRYGEHIAHCKRNVSSSTKASIKASYGVPSSETSQYEIDHRIPLSIGGSNARTNLWPLRSPDARRKSTLEQQLFDDLSAGRISQADAIQQMLDWQ